MSHICPKPCGRLITAAIFISIGVVQLIAGIILFRSKYVYLLSVPNFWTAASNVAVGSLLGISATVWKNIQKASTKHAARRNTLAALAFSAVVLNGTTASILVMGEGNALLSIHLENNGMYSTGEILAYAYASSVCSPIVCTVVAVVFLSGVCFRKSEKKSASPDLKSVLKTDFYIYNWVFKPEQRSLPKLDPEIMRKALSSESYSSYSSSSNSSEFPIRSNSLPSLKGLDTSLCRGIQRIRSHSGINTLHKLTNHDGGNTSDCAHIGNTSRGKTRVSFVDDPFLNITNFQRNALLSSKDFAQYTETKDQIIPLNYKAKSESRTSVFSRGFNGECQVVRGNIQQPRSKRLLLKDNPAFNRIGMDNTNERQIRARVDMFQEYPSTISTIHDPRNSRKVLADIHADTNPRTTEHETQQEPVLVYENNDSQAEFAKSMNLHQSNGHQKIRRTSTARNLNTPDTFSCLDASELCSDSVFHNRKSDGNNITTRDTSRDSYLNESKLDSFLDMTDSTFDTTGTNRCVGEMVAVRVNRTLPHRRNLSSKLIPVSIPNVSDVKKIPPHERLTNIDGISMVQDICNSSVERNVNKMDEASLLSFRNGMKVGSKRNCQWTNSAPEPLDHNCKNPDPPVQSTSTDVASDRTIHDSSSAQTSGYISSQDETRGSDDSGKNTSNLNSSASSRNCTTPRKFHDVSQKSLQKLWESSEHVAVADIVNRIISEDSQINSTKESISQLFHDLAFKKVMEQVLRETSV